MIKRGSKKGIEVSIGMMITIVLGVVTLILALALLRGLFSGATTSITSINSQVASQIKSIFNSDTDKDFILLGDDKIASVKADGNLFSFVAGARTNYGNAVTNRSDIQLQLELDSTSDCYKKLGKTVVSHWFTRPVMTNGVTDKVDVDVFANQYLASDSGSAFIQFIIPTGTTICTQGVHVYFFDNTQSPPESISGDYFTIQVTRSGIFG